ncbi:MAG: hypothetical protein O3C51_17410 [Planctomycetota bacterium]|nr:hypothetical protein [Planctomycetota bacterium]
MVFERSLLLAGLLCAALPSPPALAQDGPLRDLGRFRIDARLELHAVASRTLTWLTGTPEQNDYISVGRFANFFGFVKFRVSSAHSLTRSASGQESFAILALLHAQEEPFTRVVTTRLEMNRMLDRLRSGEDVERAALLAAGEEYGAAEAELGRVLAVGLGGVAVTLDDAQRAQLTELRQRSIAGRAGNFKLPRDVARAVPRGADFDSQELWNLSSRLLTWTTGTEQDNDFETVGSSAFSTRRGSAHRPSSSTCPTTAAAGEAVAVRSSPAARVGWARAGSACRSA